MLVTLPPWAAALLAPAYYVMSALVLGWDTFMAGQIAQLRSAPRTFAFMSALAALLLAPALLVDAAAGSSLAGHTFDQLAWIWPAVTILFAAQVLYATARRMVSPFLGLPILIYDLLLVVVVITRYLLALGYTPLSWALITEVAHVNVLGYVTGPAALGARFSIQLPLLAPAFPARWRASTAVRALLAVLALVWVGATALELPAAQTAIASYAALGSEPLQERPAGDFTVGLRVLPTVDAPPPASALHNDLLLVDTTGAEAISVVVGTGARNAALDSLARALEPLRRDTTALIVTLATPPGAAVLFSHSRMGYTTARLADVSRIARRLHPDYLLPVDEPYGRAERALGTLPVTYWERYLTDAAAAVHRVDPRIRIGISASSFEPRDSALYAWAAAPTSPIDVLGFTLAPDFTGGAGLNARLRAADRWMAAEPQTAAAKEHWVFTTRGYPEAHGEASQERAVWATLAWATGHSTVKGLVVADAADYEDRTGLRAPAGRLRPVVGAVSRATRNLRDAEAPEPSADTPQ
jgi:hypothetical protein